MLQNPKIPESADIIVRKVEPSAFDSFIRWFANRNEGKDTKAKTKARNRPLIEVYLWKPKRRRRRSRW